MLLAVILKSVLLESGNCELNTKSSCALKIKSLFTEQALNKIEHANHAIRTEAAKLKLLFIRINLGCACVKALKHCVTPIGQR